MISPHDRSRTCRPVRFITTLAACVMLLTACGGILPAPTLTPTAYVSPTASPTILWFPATRTPTFFATPAAQPTVELRPEAGGLLFSDSFDRPELWNTASSGTASASVTLNRLILSISGQGPLFLASRRAEPLLENFYAEVRVRTSLCRGADAYGMIFRADTAQNYYRFLVNCRGEMRLERVRYLQVDPLQDWLASSDIPLGAPAEITLGVWVVGSEMRFFLNNHYQFSARDPLFPSGTLGFFVYASGSDPVTVSFSSLTVYTAISTATTPTP